MAFRHALVRDAFYSDIPWTTRIKLHRAVAERLASDRTAPAVVADHGREVADGRQLEGDLLRLGDALHRLAAVLEMQGR
jgi:hypothetical protein